MIHLKKFENFYLNDNDTYQDIDTNDDSDECETCGHDGDEYETDEEDFDLEDGIEEWDEEDSREWGDEDDGITESYTNRKSRRRFL